MDLDLDGMGTMADLDDSDLDHGDLDGLVSVFALDEETGVPTLQGVVGTHGKVPRDMLLSADGTLCLVANQNSRTIATFSVDLDTGALTHRHTTEPTVFSPVSLLIIE